MKITMLKTALGSPDGVQVRSYEAGETYDLGESLARAFVGDGVAEPADKPKPEAKPASKKRAAQRADKAEGPAAENKTE